MQKKPSGNSAAFPKEHRAHETIHLPADQPHRAEVTMEWLKIKKVNIR